MSEHDARIRVDRVDWPSVLPWVALFRSASMALHPAKLALALLLVALLYLGGAALDVIWWGAAPPGEPQVDRWTDTGWGPAAGLEQRRLAEEAGVFETTLAVQRQGFALLLRSAVHLDFGLSGFLAGQGFEAGGVMRALGLMFVAVPAWLIKTHPVFLLLYLAWAFLVTALLGGAIARLAALQACINRRDSLSAALRFVGTRYPWFLLAPLTPVLLVAVIGLGIMIAGVLFNLPGLDVIAALGYGLMLAGGLIAALLVIGLATAGHLLLPTLAVEGTDAFDAMSRAYNYTLGRPVRYLFYTLVSLVYGAAVYLVLSLLLFLGLWLTWMFANQWVFAEAADGVSRFEGLLAPPSLIDLAGQPGAELGVVGTIASIVLRGWTYLLVGLLAAFAVSFYFCANTWIYLLLRRAADGTGFDDVFAATESEDDALPEAAPAPEKIEPEAR